jgi:hypothetical protein
MDAITAMTRALGKLYEDADEATARRAINLLGDEGFDLVEGVSARANRIAAEVRKSLTADEVFNTRGAH